LFDALAGGEVMTWSAREPVCIRLSYLVMVLRENKRTRLHAHGCHRATPSGR
jgi:hypothetical protein